MSVYPLLYYPFYGVHIERGVTRDGKSHRWSATWTWTAKMMTLFSSIAHGHIRLLWRCLDGMFGALSLDVAHFPLGTSAKRYCICSIKEKYTFIRLVIG